MSVWRFAEPQAALVLLLLPVLLAWGLWHLRKGRQLLAQRFSAELAGRLGLGRLTAGRKFAWPLLGLSLIIFALMRPQGDPESVSSKQKRRDLVILLDLSKSMYAQDLRPNRLERAKGMILDLTEALQGERIALIGFAGTAKLLSPLTLDYTYYQNILTQAQPEDMSRGGTALGEALRQALDLLFYDDSKARKEILLITDGEDQDTDPLGAARKAREMGVKIHTLGLGAPNGAPIPTANGPLTFQGQVVRSKPDLDTLERIAQTTGGLFLPAETKRVHLGEIYRAHLERAEEATGESKQTWVWQELYLWVAWPAALVWLLVALGRVDWPLHRPLKRRRWSLRRNENH